MPVLSRTLYKSVSAASLLVLLSACGVGQSVGLFEPGPVHVEARQEKLETDVDEVGERYRALKDRFDALERLYVDLARNTRETRDTLTSIESTIGSLSGTTASQASITRLAEEIGDLQESVKGMENRVFSLELNGPMLGPAQPQPQQTVSQGGAEASSDTAAPQNQTPVESEAEIDRVQYGVHLGSYRSMDQVPGSWIGLRNAFAEELAGLEPRVYSQSLQGIGDLVRLIAGPVETQAEAESICQAVKLRGREQYCEATEFQGEPLS